MPCWARYRVSVRIRAENLSVLLKALQAQDSEVELIAAHENSISIRYKQTGERASIDVGADGHRVVAEVDVAGDIANAINRTYSREVIRSRTSRYGWDLEQTGANKFVAVRRS